MFIDYNNINELIEYMICFYIPKINTYITNAVGTALGIWLLIFSPIDLFKCSESHTQHKIKMIYCNLI